MGRAVLRRAEWSCGPGGRAMPAQAVSRDSLLFADEAPTPAADVAPWKILVADDEEEVHKVTKLALTDFTHFGRPLQFLHAYTGAQAVQIMRDNPDIALVLMDVVMETEHAGLNAVLAIRNDLRNRLTRIVIRTGQPGQAPESLVVRHYDINDYKEKTEVTARKLHTLVHNGLSLYRELSALTTYKEGLEQLIGASAALQAQRSEEQFGRSALQQLAIMLYAEAPRMPSDMFLAVRSADGSSRVLTGTGYYAGCAGRRLEETLGSDALADMDLALRGRAVVFGPQQFLAASPLAAGAELRVYIAGEAPARSIDAAHVSLFCHNIATGYDNLKLNRQLKDSQRNLILLLSTAIEQRMHTGGGHGQRVATYVRLLAELHGLPEDVLDWLPLAATLHDVGQIAIPEALLNKRDRLTPDEQALMETHTRWGQDLLSSQDSEVLQMAGLIAAQHHEHWDGRGYPNRLAGPQIHQYARITALADAFDELLHGAARLGLTEALVQIEAERGRRFDPLLVNLLVKNIDRFKAVGRGAH
jgi:response regulator RpfG family c-di-GMP phosphodiesterase